MTAILIFLSFIACRPADAVVEALEGRWSLTQVDLFQGEELNGTNPSGDEPVVYYFRKDGQKSELVILQDNVSETYLYDYDRKSKTIWLDSKKKFVLEQLDSERLILSDSYETYRSVYTFSRQD